LSKYDEKPVRGHCPKYGDDYEVMGYYINKPLINFYRLEYIRCFDAEINDCPYYTGASCPLYDEVRKRDIET